MCPRANVGMVSHAFNPSSWGEETRGSLKVQGQPDLHSKFLDSQSYIRRHQIQRTKTKMTKYKKKKKKKGIRKMLISVVTQIVGYRVCPKTPDKKKNYPNTQASGIFVGKWWKILQMQRTRIPNATVSPSHDRVPYPWNVYNMAA